MGDGQLVEHHHKARLWACPVQRIGQAVVQGIKVFAEVGRKVKLQGNQVQRILLGLGMGQIGVEEVVPHGLCRLLQVRNVEGTNGLHDVAAHPKQQVFGGRTRRFHHLWDSFYSS